MITRSDVLAHLEASVKANFLNAARGYQPLRSAFVEEVSTNKPFEIYADMGAAPMPTQVSGQVPGTATDARTGVPVVGGAHEGGPVTVSGGNERGLIVWNRGFASTIGVYHDAINDANVNLDAWAAQMGARFEQHKDKLAFDALNAGAASTYGTAYDGQVFFYASHADKNASYTTAQSNVNALALSLDNFETVYINATSYKDDRGEPAGIVPDLLVHSVNLTRTAAQITDNREDYALTDRKMNPYAGALRRLQAPGGYLDSTAWYLVCSQPGMKPLGLQMRQPATFRSWDDYTQGGGIHYIQFYSRYEIFYRDWRSGTQGNT